jgi:hypothetical protein
MRVAVIPTAIFVFALTMSQTAAANAETIRLEAEAFTAYRDVFYGLIRGMEDPNCTGGFKLVGLDWVNEWTEYDLTVHEFGNWTVEMRCRGELGVHFTILLTLTGVQSGNSQSIDFEFVGDGAG